MNHNKRRRQIQLLLIIICLLILPANALAYIHHELTVIIEPQNQTLKVKDKVSFPEDFLKKIKGIIKFKLHNGLTLSNNNVVHLKDSYKTEIESVPLNLYQVRLPNSITGVELTYQGKIYHLKEKTSEEYARSFSETPGTIEKAGVFLGGSSYWYPVFDNELVTFTLDVQLPELWKVVSQGDRSRFNSGEDSVQVLWESPEPQEEIYLIAGKFVEYSQKAGKTMAYAFLRSPDEKLAKRYLNVTGKYLQRYSELIGPYPYSKFALVENFWETGYAMPSFTLLGSTVIRLPFIVYTSYPHEILHNWWGNGVYVDYSKGNWCEGLTAYLADYLNQEKKGKGVEYRRTVLQKYADFVAKDKDFPLSQFRSRRSAATEAIGYGKAMMFFHMLRRQLGDELFLKALQHFYKSNLFKRASYYDIEEAFNSVTGQNLGSFFTQWVERTGAPALAVNEPDVEHSQQGYKIHFTIKQTQKTPVYSLNLPVTVVLDDKDELWQTSLKVSKRLSDFTLHVPAKPVQINIDPDFDLFRKLDRSEIPPALSQAFGDERAMFVLPSTAPEKLFAAYRQIAERWSSSDSDLQGTIRKDSELDKLPNDRAVWIFGWNNGFRKELIEKLEQYNVKLNETSIFIDGAEFSKADYTVVFAARQHSNHAIVWIGTDNPSAISGLSRKLSHYSKYSYLVFTGNEPENIQKGQWPVLKSPLSVRLSLDY